MYFTTYCRNNCNFCYYRNSNKIERYRKSHDEIIATAEALIKSGVNLIDLTMGEDPEYIREDFASVCSLIREIKTDKDTPVMISPGVVADRVIDNLADAGCDFFALYQETHNRELFDRLRVGQSYDERMHAKLYAREKGMYIEEGLLAGVGESDEDIADSLMIMGEIGARQVRVMSFVPQEGSPMENHDRTCAVAVEVSFITANETGDEDELTGACEVVSHRRLFCRLISLTAGVLGLTFGEVHTGSDIAEGDFAFTCFFNHPDVAHIIVHVSRVNEFCNGSELCTFFSNM